jgi:hypothetical protein
MFTEKRRREDDRNVAQLARALLGAAWLALALAGATFGQAQRVAADASGPARDGAQRVDTSVQGKQRVNIAAASIVSLPTPRDPREIARTARVVYVHSKTLHVPAATFENELRKRADFQSLGLVVTRDPTAADLWIELDRNLFTRTFVLTAFDPKSNTLVISARKKAYLLIGDRVAAKLAKSFIRQMRETRGT